MGAPHRRRRLGSSPLARGLPIHMACESAEQGIIPARAGFTAHALAAAGGAGDHPRSRGVYAAIAVTTSMIGGSSPLARGLPTLPKAAYPRLGIIPARAGFTRS